MTSAEIEIVHASPFVSGLEPFPCAICCRFFIFSSGLIGTLARESSPDNRHSRNAITAIKRA